MHEPYSTDCVRLRDVTSEKLHVCRQPPKSVAQKRGLGFRVKPGFRHDSYSLLGALHFGQATEHAALPGRSMELQRYTKLHRLADFPTGQD